MKTSPFFAALLLTWSVAAMAQTTPATKTTTAKTTQTTPTQTTPATTPAGAPQQVTEVTEDLDPATGKVIRRTTRTTTVPAGTTAPARTPTASPSDTAYGAATDAQVTNFLRKKTVVATLTAPALLDAYNRFIERVRTDRHTWKSADWSNAAAILSRLNERYDQLRSSFSLDDKVTIRSQQAEFQTLRTARQLSDQVSDKL